MVLAEATRLGPDRGGGEAAALGIGAGAPVGKGWRRGGRPQLERCPRAGRRRVGGQGVRARVKEEGAAGERERRRR